jgi:CBS-domain-containing membrane protein
MLCSDVMKLSPHSVRATDTVRAAAQLMNVANVGFLPVCNANHQVVGTITDRDIAVRCVAMGIPPTSSVGTIMTKGAITCLASDGISRAHSLMAQHKKSRLLCCDENGELKGVISLSDLATLTDGPSAVNTLRRVATREVHA